MELKDTLHLGKTKFKMRANLPEREVIWQKEWEEDNLYQKIQEKNADRPTYVLHDGPPYANGKIHIGHALNKISKDFIVRYKSMTGYRSPYVPGWDTHGLPIESALINRDGINRDELSTAEFRKLCEEYALEQVEGQKASFKRLGVAGDWDNPYLTLTPDYEAQQIRVFGKMAAKGLIYRGLKPVYWSPSSQTSLAEAEVEYKDVKSDSIYVSFKVKDGKGVVDENCEFVIWTTTPWTLPANLGITVSPTAEYVEVKVGERTFILASELVEEVSQKAGWESYTLGKRYKGEDFEYLTAQHPFYDRESLLMLGDHVTLDTGTGLVHTAPGHGDDDYMMALKYDLDILSPVDDRGHFTDEAPGFEGMFYIKGNREVIKVLEENESLLAHETIEHSYPHDWRTKKPIIFRSTPQWFASIDKIRDDLLDSVENDVTWYHPSGQRRMYNMIKDRGDWVISRQRVWGVPLPIFYAENGEPILDQDVINHVADLVEEHGSNIWFEKEAEELLPEGYTHPSSPNGKFTKETDIMDVWFDSGTSYAGVLMKREDLAYPADLYLEGSDQYRGWFNSSFTTSVAAFEQPPYKAVLSQGFVMDGKGEKMSKSVGNVIDPEEVMKELGADIIRLWVASVDSENDVRVSKEILKQTADSYRKIRNTIRFMLANLSDFDPEVNSVPVEKMRKVDQWMLAKHTKVVSQIYKAYDNFKFNEVYHRVLNYFINDLSAFYLDFAKDVLYIEAEDDLVRRSMQTVIYKVLKEMLIILTPILVHTTEEAWSHLVGAEGYIQLQDFPEAPTNEELEEAEGVLEEWQVFFDVRTDILKALEERRTQEEDPITKSFDTKVTLYASQELRDELASLSDSLDQLLIVSQFEMKDLSEKSESAMGFEAGYSVEVDHAQGEKCERCWATRVEVGTLADESVCERCYDVIKQDAPEYYSN